MDQPTTTSGDMPEIADRLAQATQSLADALCKLDGQFTSLHASAQPDTALQLRLAELEKTNHDLKAQSETARRKTLSPVVTAILAKEGVEGAALIEAPVVEKALAGLSIEQRIAVKAELARAGILV